jgi:hypothetical protein
VGGVVGVEALDGVLVDAAPYDGAEAAASTLVGARRVLDTDLPRVTSTAAPLVVHLTGGAGQVAGPAGLCRKRGLPLAALTVTLRDLDALVGNVRRVVAAVDAARAEGMLDDGVTIRVALPPEPVGHGWLAAADEAAGAELELALPLTTGGTLIPGRMVADWVDAALDRETPYSATGGGPATRGPDTHGVLNLLAATAALWDGRGAEEASRVLDSPEPPLDGLAAGRRWCRGIEVSDAAATADEIRALLG